MRGAIKFILTLILGIALIWLGFWWYAEIRLQNGFIDWADNQATKGWKISYDSIRRGTSLLDAAVTIDDLSLTPPPSPAGEIVTLSLPAVTLRIDAFNPLVFHTDLPSKMTLGIDNGFGLVFTTGSIALAEDLDPAKLFDRAADPFRGGNFSASNIDVLASAGSLLVLHIDSITSRAELNLNAGAARTAIATQSTLDGLAVSPLLARIASLPFHGRLSHLAFAFRFSGPMPGNLPDLLDEASARPGDLQYQQKLLMPVLHQWASQGGSASASGNLVLGPSTLKADGALRFDANLQPNGTADLQADHLDQFTAALIAAYPALDADIARAEAELSPYLSNTDQGGQVLTLHLVYGPPGILINGHKTADMAPMDWNQAENPQPPPAQSPGDGSGAASPATP